MSMKAFVRRVFHFGVFLLVSLFISVAFNTTETYAAGESFEWSSSNQIVMDGGDFRDFLVDGTNTSPLHFQRSGPNDNTLQADRSLTFSGGGETCSLFLEITLPPAELTGSPEPPYMPHYGNLGVNGNRDSDNHPNCVTVASEFADLVDGSLQNALGFYREYDFDGVTMDTSDASHLVSSVAYWREGSETPCNRRVPTPQCVFDARSDYYASIANSPRISLGNWEVVYEGLEDTVNSCTDSGGSIDDCMAEALVEQRDNEEIEYGEGDTSSSSDDDESEPVCVGGAIGWILCPISELATEGMGVLAGVVQAMLTVQPLNIATPEQEPVYIIWNVMRNVANILFIIAFLVVVMSYVTSMGISNYGIKRTLPRLIIAAVLVNISYFIAAIMIDIFNIIGASIEGLFQTGINAAVGSVDEVRTGASGWQWGAFIATFTASLTGIIVVAGPSVLLLLIPPIISAAFAILTLAIILIARQFIITLLVIASPLIAVAWLLPGTEQYFKKGMNFFFSLLVSFPVVMAVMQASSLIVAIMYVNGIAPGVPGGGPDEWGTAVGVLLVQVVVVAASIQIIRSSTAIAKQLGVLGGGMVSGLRGAAASRIGQVRGNSRYAFRKKDRADFRSTRAQGRYDRGRRKALGGWRGGMSYRVPGTSQRVGFGARHETQQRAAYKNQSQERQLAEAKNVAKLLKDDPSYRARYAGSSDQARKDAALARGIEQAGKLQAAEVAAAKVVIENDATVANPNALASIAAGQNSNYQSESYRMAAFQKGIEQGDTKVINGMLQNVNGNKASQEFRDDVAAEVAKNHSALRNTALYTANSDIRDKVKNGKEITNDDIIEATKERMEAGNISAAILSKHDATSLGYVKKAEDELIQEADRLGSLSVRSTKQQKEFESAQKTVQATQESAYRALNSETVRSGVKQSIVDGLNKLGPTPPKGGTPPPSSGGGAAGS